MLTGREYEETADGLGHFASWTDVSARIDPGLVFDALASRAERALSAADDAHEDTLATGLTDPAARDIGFVCEVAAPDAALTPPLTSPVASAECSPWPGTTWRPSTTP